MNNNDVFITRAMLSSYHDDRKDYVDLVIPFLTNCLPKEKNTMIDIKEVASALNSTYDLDVPHNMVKKMLNKLCKKRNDAHIRKSEGEYYIEKPYDLSEFEQKQQKIKKSINAVISKLKDYLKNVKFIPNVTDELAKTYLTTFLDTYNYTVYDDASCLNTVTKIKGDNIASINYYVAQFVLKEYESQSEEYNSLLEIIKGFLTAKSIYYFMKAENASTTQKIEGTTFILDTRLLISALGLHLEQEKQATDELLELITKNGGKLATFDYYVSELAGIITRYEKDSSARPYLSLDSFKRQNYNSADAHAYLEQLDQKLAALKITVLEKEYCDKYTEDKNWAIDYSELRNKLKEIINYSDEEGLDYSTALENDASTIQAVSYLREAPHSCNIFNCKYIFVTPNSAICQVVAELYKKERFIPNRELSFTITDIDLTSILWLSSFGSKTDFPQLKLIENSYSACAPSKDLMTTFLNKIKSCEENATISRETAILLRSYRSYDDLTEITGNDPSNVDEKTVQQIENKMMNKLRKEAVSGLSNREKNLNSKEDDINDRIKEIDKREKATNDREFILNKKEVQLNKQSKNVERANLILERHQASVEKTATFWKKAIERFLCGLYIIASILLTVLVYFLLKRTVPASAAGFVSIAVSVAGFVSLIYAGYLKVLPLIKRLGVLLYDSIYSKRINFYDQDSGTAS